MVTPTELRVSKNFNRVDNSMVPLTDMVICAIPAQVSNRLLGELVKLEGVSRLGENQDRPKGLVLSDCR